MPLDLTAALIVFLGFVVWRLARRTRAGGRDPLPDVGDASPSAEPALVWRYNDDGFTRYLAEAPSVVTAEPETDESVS